MFVLGIFAFVCLLVYLTSLALAWSAHAFPACYIGARPTRPRPTPNPHPTTTFSKLAFPRYVRQKIHRP